MSRRGNPPPERVPVESSSYNYVTLSVVEESPGRVPLVGVVCDGERITVDLLRSAVFVNT